MTEANIRIRRPQFADDMWYSSQADRLQQDIQAYLEQATPELEPERLLGLVAPHAGHRFSGHVAGAAFAPLGPDAFERVVLVGPDHRGAAMGQLATPAVDAWRTPLGDVPVDWGFLEALRQEIELRHLSGDEEHSLEIELPFLQVALAEFELVPLIMGDQSIAACRRLGEALAALIGPEEQRTLLVASSDLSHFFHDDTARQLDEETLQLVLTMDADGLVRHVEQGRRRGEPLACGGGPIAAIIHAARGLGATEARLIKYATSADVAHNKERVVGYGAVALVK